MKKMKFFIVLAVVFTMVGCGKKKEENQIKEIIKPIVAHKLENRVMNQRFRSDAIFAPVSEIDHFTEHGGTITKILKHNGEHVNKGDLIMVLHDAPTKANYYTAKSNFEIARNNYKKFKKLYDEKLISYLEYVNYENNFIKARGNYENAKSDFDKLNRKAEISGTIGNLFGKIGEKVKSSDNLFTIINDENMETYIGFPAEWLSQIKVGQEVNVDIPAISQKFTGTLTQINPIAQKDTKKFLIKIIVPNPKKAIKDGMYSYITVPAGKRNGLAIEDEAIITRNLTNYVFKVVDGVAHRIEVKLGATNLPYTQISSSELKEGDEIVVQGVFGLEDGEKVKESSIVK